MARPISGEANLSLGGKLIRLRLEVGTIIDLEEYFDKGITEIVAEASKGRIGRLSALFLAMQGKDFTDRTLLEEAGQAFRDHGIDAIASKMVECLKRSLYAKE